MEWGLVLLPEPCTLRYDPLHPALRILGGTPVNWSTRPRKGQFVPWFLVRRSPLGPAVVPWDLPWSPGTLRPARLTGLAAILQLGSRIFQTKKNNTCAACHNSRLQLIFKQYHDLNYGFNLELWQVAQMLFFFKKHTFGRRKHPKTLNFPIKTHNCWS